MTVITGDLRLVSDRAAEVTQVHVRARETRAEDGGLTLGKSDNFPVQGGFLEISVRPGPAFLVLVYVGGAVESVPILVADLESESLENVVNSAKVATSGNREWLEKLAAEVIAGTQGPKGNSGPPPHLSIQSVVTTPPGSEATASISGEAGNYSLRFGIPRGDTGSIEEIDDAVQATIDALAIPAIHAARDSSIDYATTKIGEYRDEALNEADLAIAEAKDANSVSRVAALEAMGGLSPESPVDGQTANLISQPGSLSNSAVGSVAVPRVTTAAQESATLGPELITSAGWSFGEGWSGDFATGFTKTPGGVGTLRWTPDFDPGTDLYLVEWKWEGSATHQDVYSGYDVYFGNGYAGITYQGGPPSNASYSRAIKSEMNRGLDVVPWESFEGRIHSISVRKVVSPAAVGVGWRTSGGTRGGELRFGDRNASSVFLGIDSGKYNYSGSRNAAVGAFSMAENVSGFFNAALGFGALQRNTNGTRNVAVGYNALSANTAGDRNIGVGPFALTRNTTGQRNVAVGTDVLWRNETGSDNVGIGYLTATELRTGFSNVAIGKYAMRHTHGATYGGTQHNIAIGEESLSRVLGEGSVAIGHRAASQYSGNNVVAVGNEALEYNTTAGSQTAIGYKALRYNTGGRNTAIGNASLCGLEGQSTGQRNVAVGDNAGVTVTSGSQNTIIGPSAGSNVTSQNGNILIGFAANGLTGKDNFLNIGNVLYGDLSTQQIGIGINAPTARLHLKASTGEAGTSPIKLNGGTLLTTPEVGALEFASGRLYFTTSTGVRREIAFVTT